MSLLSAHVTPRVIEIVVDTLGYDADGFPRAFVTKAFSLPHLGVVLAGRGPMVITYEVGRETLATVLDGFDDMQVAMPVIFRRVCDRYREEFGRQSAGSIGGFAEIYAFGYSAERKRMAGVRFVSDGENITAAIIADGGSFVPHPADPDFLAAVRGDPRIELLRRAHHYDLSKFRSPGTFIAVAKMQQILARAIGQNVGGDLLLYRLTKHELTVKRIYRFADRDEMWADLRPEAPALEEADAPEPSRTAFAPNR